MPYYCLEGTIRSRTVEETLAWLRPLLSKAGITRVANVTGLDHVGIPVVTCIRPGGKHLSVAQGKGVAVALAEASAMMEAMEIYHAEQPLPGVLYGSYNALQADHPVCDPACFGRKFRCKKALRNMSVEWVDATNLLTEEVCYIPRDVVHMDATQYRSTCGSFEVNSNGLAGGNTWEEAVCHALYEVVERDALCRWQKLREKDIEATQLDITTITTTCARRVLDQFARAQLPVAIWEITSDIAVPAFQVAIGDENVPRRLGLFTGTGAHVDTEIALVRALTEAAQSRLTLISGSRDDIFPNYYQRLDQPYFAEIENGKRAYADCCHMNYQHSFADNIQQVLAMLRAKGLTQVYCVNHTQPALNVPVVQLFVPGLQFNGARM